MTTSDLPAELALNAWTGGPAAATGPVRPDAARWGARRGLPHAQQVLPIEPLVDDAQWADPRVGYGVLLPDDDDPGLDAAAKATGQDAPEPVRRLLRARPGTAVLRWRADLDQRFLRRYFADGGSQDATIGLSAFGTGKGRLPRYVLIVGGPDRVPWSVQYALNVRHATGRLPLAGEALGRYVDALLSGWAGVSARRTAPLVWTVDHGAGDITALMRAVVADPLGEALVDPALPGTVRLTGAAATGDALLDALRRHRPALLATSSHGRTGPLDDASAMAAGLGLPVDAGRAAVPLADLAAAVPAGAIWYAAACCSAGGDATSQFADLLVEGSGAHAVVSAVAGLGATVAPAAMALLGRADPVRAVVGHVEPTFDWTLRVGETGQGLGHELVAALSTQLYADRPVGLAFAGYWAAIGQLHSQWAQRRAGLQAGDVAGRALLTRLRLTALDRQSLVLLGDPTVPLAP